MTEKLPFTLHHTIEAAAARAVEHLERDEPTLVALIKLYVEEDVQRWISEHHQELRERLEEGNKRIEHATALTGVLLERVEKVLAIPYRDAATDPYGYEAAEGYNTALYEARTALGETE